MKRALCGGALIGALLMMTSCAGTEQLLAGGSGMFLKLGPATLGLGNTQQGWLALNSMNWAGNQHPQQGYPVATYPQQAYGYPQQAYGYPQQAYPQQTYPQQTYDATGQAYGTQQTHPQQTYPQQTYPQQTYDATGQAYGAQQTYPQDTTGQTYGNQAYGNQTYGAAGGAETYPQTAAAETPPPGPGLASFTTNDPAAAQALAQACASGQPMGPVTVRQLQADGTYQDIQLNGVNLACGSPAAGGQKGEALKPGDEVVMTFSDAKVVSKGKLKKPMSEVR